MEQTIKVIGATAHPSRRDVASSTTGGVGEGEVPIRWLDVCRDGIVVGADFTRVGELHAERSALTDMKTRGVR